MRRQGPAQPAPEHICAQLADLVLISGRSDLDVRIALRVGSRDTCVDFDGNTASSPATILLGTQDVDIPEARRRVVIGHELAHVVRRRDGLTHFGLPSRVRRRAGLQAVVIYPVGTLSGLAMLVWSALRDKPLLGLVGLVVIPAAIMLTLAITSRLRREDETATDILAAVSFGAVFEPEDVERNLQLEGRTARFTPVIFREHLRPEQRRQVQLAAPSAFLADPRLS